MRPFRLAPVALAIALSACGQGADPDAVLETVRLTEIAQQEAMIARDIGGVMRVYADDARVTAPRGIEAQGAAAIGSAFTELLTDPNLAMEVTPGEGWAAASGDLAVTNSLARITVTDPDSGAPVTASLTNQTVWRKADGAPWRIVSERIAVTSPREAMALAER